METNLNNRNLMFTWKKFQPRTKLEHESTIKLKQQPQLHRKKLEQNRRLESSAATSNTAIGQQTWNRIQQTNLKFQLNPRIENRKRKLKYIYVFFEFEIKLDCISYQRPKMTKQIREVRRPKPNLVPFSISHFSFCASSILFCVLVYVLHVRERWGRSAVGLRSKVL